MIRPHSWHLLGAGAMGTLLCQRLQAVGHPAVLTHHRSGGAERFLRDGEQSFRLPVLSLADTAPRSISRLLLTTKAGQVEAALALAAPHLCADAVVVISANGLGFETRLKTRYPGVEFFRAVSTAGAYREGPERVVFAAEGRTRIGGQQTSGPAPAWFSDSLALLAAWSWENPIDAALGHKFALNCVINALTATLRCNNGELLRGQTAGPELAALCAESEPVLRRLGLWQAELSLVHSAVSVCVATASNRSSMLQDVLAGRDTEIEFLNAELIRRALPLGLDLPLNKALCTRLSQA